MAFEVRVADVPELGAGDPVAVASENARRKALAVAARAPGRRDVLGADTVVALDDRLLGKPRDLRHARAMLSALSAREHQVVSAVCVVRDAAVRDAVATTRVRMRELDEAWLCWYLATGEWRERAGAYAIQGAGAALTLAVAGDYSGVVGLPVAALLELLPDLLIAQ